MPKGMVLSLIESRIGNKLEADTPLRELSLDSLDYVDLKCFLEQETGKDIDWNAWAACQGVSEILALFAEDD